MKKILMIVLMFNITVAYCQTDKYDGDWYYSYSGDCGSGPGNKGSGKVVYRIRTVEGNTSVRVKQQYPCESEYEYWQCNVTKCDENGLEWHSCINQYEDYENPNVIIKIEYYCRLVNAYGSLQAQTYYVQSEVVNNKLINSVAYGSKDFTLYKDDNDW